MSELDRWFRRQAERDQRLVALEEALLGGRLWRYSWYRLRWFFLTYLAESASHAVLVLVAFEGLGWNNFLLVVVAFAASTLISQFWWGALEAMRAQVRDLHRSGRPNRIPAAVGGWLAFAAIPAAGFGLAAIAWTAWHLAGGSLGAAEALVGVMFLRLALDLPVRAYHSGIYAMRRVYKPLRATLAPEAIALVAILALSPFAGVWALVVSTLLSTLVMTALTILYTSRVYHFLGFAPQHHIHRRSLRGAWREFLAGGAAHAAMALDSLAVLGLLSGARTDSRALVVLFLSMPTIRAGAEWARLLYFDFKRLELRLFSNLRRRFERHNARLAIVLGVAFWAVAALIATLFYEEGLGELYPALLAFFLARSALAREQIQAFADRSYGAVLGTGLACVAGLGVVGVVGASEPERLGGVAVVTIGSALVLGRVLRTERRHGEPGTALLTLEWLCRLGEVRTPVRIGSARVVGVRGPDRPDAVTRDERNRWRLAQLAERAAHRLGGTGAAAWMGPDRVVWFEHGDRHVTPDWLARVSGGLVCEVVTRECPDGEHALLEAGQGELLGQSSSFLLTPVVPVDATAVRRTYDELVSGVVYAPDAPVPAELAALPGEELRAIFADAAAFSRDLGLRRARSRFDVTTLCSGGRLELIFVSDPARSGKRTRARWRHRATALNVRASIGGLRVAPPRPTRMRRRPALVP